VQYRYRCSGIWVTVFEFEEFGIAPIHHGKYHQDGERLWLDTDELSTDESAERDTTRNASCLSSDGTRSVPRSSSAWHSKRHASTAT
jgi:hypothetical protein